MNYFKWNNKELDTINKMVLLRKGKNIPFRIIYLVGPKKDKVIIKEREILGDYAEYLSGSVKDEANKEKAKFKSEKMVIACIPDNEVPSTGKIIDTSNLRLYRAEDFIKDLALDNATLERLALSDEMLDTLDKYKDDIIVKMVMYHYENNDDNNLTDNDITFLKQLLGTNNETQTKQNNEPKVSNDVPKSETKKPEQKNDTLSRLKQFGKANTSETKNEARYEEPKSEPKEESKETELTPEEELAKIKADIAKTKQRATNTETSVETNTETFKAPKPSEQKPKKEDEVKSKTRLTRAEYEQNQLLIDDIKQTYKHVLSVLRDEQNDKYNTIISNMQSCLDNYNFNKIFSSMYLEISDDISSPIYELIYELDRKTIEFNEKIIHHVMPVMCISCGNKWKEDITFLSKGAHTVRCKMCETPFSFEKEDYDE